MDVRLKPELEQFLKESVRQGHYLSVEDAMNAAVAQLQRHSAGDDEYELSDDDRAAIEEGIAQAERGECRPWDEVREELKREFGIK